MDFLARLDCIDEEVVVFEVKGKQLDFRTLS